MTSSKTALMITTAPPAEVLLAEKAAILADLQTVQVALYDKSSDAVRQKVTALQAQQTALTVKLQQANGLAQATQTELNQISSELATIDAGLEEALLTAIGKQRWWCFVGNDNIVYDSLTGYLWPNLKTWTWGHIETSRFMLPELDKFWRLPTREDIVAICETKKVYPSLQDGIQFYIGEDLRHEGTQSYVRYNSNSVSDVSRNNPHSSYNYGYYVPCISQFADPKLAALDLTAKEKAQRVLLFFIQQNWQPVLTEEKLTQTYFKLVQRFQLQKRLAAVEQKLAELPPPSKPQITVTVDYANWLKDYPLAEVNQSLWQYCQTAHAWFNYLLNYLEEWSQQQQPLLEKSDQITLLISEQRNFSRQLHDDEKTALTHRQHTLAKRLPQGLQPVRAALLHFRQQIIELDEALEQVNSVPNALQMLAVLSQQARPPLEFLVEHTAQLASRALQQLAALEQHQDLMLQLVASEKAATQAYNVFVDKELADLRQHALDNQIEVEQVATWCAEWRHERWQLEQQWWPLVQNAFEENLSLETVVDVLATLPSYQQVIDQFYQQERLAIHTKFAFDANGHRQEKMEKALALAKLTHQWLATLQPKIFALKTTAEKITLVRWAQVWQQQGSEEVIRFLQQEQLVERGELSQIVLNEMRQLQQRTLESCLQDAKTFSKALKKQEDDYNKLMFKMRKELQK